MMKNYISSMAAMNAVMNELGLDGQEIYGLSVVRADGLYELRFCTDFTAYDCYADAVSRSSASTRAPSRRRRSATRAAWARKRYELLSPKCEENRLRAVFLAFAYRTRRERMKRGRSAFAKRPSFEAVYPL